MTFLLMALAWQPVSQVSADGGVMRMDGRCVYSDAVLKHRDDTTLALCDALEIHRDGPVADLEFRQKSWGRMMRFSGKMEAHRLTVTSLTLRNGDTLDAEGSCEIFHVNERISNVSCLATARSRAYAASFKPSQN